MGWRCLCMGSNWLMSHTWTTSGGWPDRNIGMMNDSNLHFIIHHDLCVLQGQEVPCNQGSFLWMHPANERQCYNVTLSLIGWAHSQKQSPCNSGSTHVMMMSSHGNAFCITGLSWGESLQSFDVFFDVSLNKLLKQSGDFRCYDTHQHHCHDFLATSEI